MDTAPNFSHFIEGIDNKKQKNDAFRILKHVWGLLDKNEQKVLFPLIAMVDLMNKSDKASKEELHEYKEMLSKHPEAIEMFKHFYSKVVTPVTSKDQFKNDRIKAAAGLEKCAKELQHKNLVKNFEIKRVA